MRVLVVCLAVALLLAAVLPVHAQVIKVSWGKLKAQTQPGETPPPPPPHRAGLWLYPLLLTLVTLP